MTPGKMVEGKSVIVTGAGRGIGRAIALLMAQHGARVVVNDIGVSLAGEGGDRTPEACAEHLYPAMKSWFYPLERTADVFSWDSI